MTGLTAILPCYNEGAQVETAYRSVTAELGSIENLELLFIDDGSTDDTLERIKRLAATDPRVHYISFARNFGLVAAITAGYRYARQPWSVQLDLVFGIRRVRHDPWPRRAGAAGTHWVARNWLGIEVPNGASSFRVVRTAVGRTIVNLPTGNAHFVAKAPEIGARYATVLVDHLPRSAGSSKFRFGRLAGDGFELLFGFSWRPLNATYLVAACTAGGALVVAPLGALGVVPPRMVAGAGLLASGATAAAVAVVGRYLHRRMLDVRPRRIYYVREANIPVLPEDLIDGGEPVVAPPRCSAGLEVVR
jgi:glycosyltransferase involved in cell wall biosynthesis